MKNSSMPPVVNQTTLRILYFTYKEYIIPTGVIFVNICIFVFVLFPQVQQLLDTQAKAQSAKDRLVNLNQNIAIASSLSADSLDKQLQLTYTALPNDKDFAGVVTAISTAALISRVSLGDYDFQIGDIEKSEGADTTISVALVLTGKASDIQQFIVTLKKQFPLSDVIEVHITQTGASLTVVFYYKPIQKITFEAASPITPLSSQEVKILDSLTRGSVPTVLAPSISPSPAGVQQ